MHLYIIRLCEASEIREVLNMYHVYSSTYKFIVRMKEYTYPFIKERVMIRSCTRSQEVRRSRHLI